MFHLKNKKTAYHNLSLLFCFNTLFFCSPYCDILIRYEIDSNSVAPRNKITTKTTCQQFNLMFLHIYKEPDIIFSSSVILSNVCSNMINIQRLLKTYIKISFTRWGYCIFFLFSVCVIKIDTFRVI